jgi:hypothetical protein
MLSPRDASDTDLLSIGGAICRRVGTRAHVVGFPR